MSSELIALGITMKSVCGLASKVSKNITEEWKLAKLNKEKQLKLQMYNIFPQVTALPRDERDF